MAGKINPNEIIGQLTTAVVRTKLVKGKNHYIIDFKLMTQEPSDVMFKMEGMVSKIVGVKIEPKQLEIGDSKFCG